MKKYLSLLLALALALSMAACAAPEDDGNTGDGGAQPENSTKPEAAAAAPENTPENVPDKDEGDAHSPAPAEADNILPHDPAGYCGNTVTTVKFDGIGTAEEKWEKSFWGDESVRMTDLLLFLDYSEDICRCLPEYTVDTEFGEGYGINLSESYVRHDGHQVTLTEEQTAELREIIEWAREQD